MKYKYRVVYTGEITRVLYDGSIEHSKMKDQPCSWCKTAENAERIFKNGIESFKKRGAECIINEYHIETKIIN